MYYIIETQYVGPNRHQDRYVDADTIEISRRPAVTNSSHEVRTEGWCGTTNDSAVYAHGEYATINEARTAITEKFGEVRDSDPDGVRFESDDPDDFVEVFKPGKYTPLSADETADWAYEGIQSDIAADTTDARIAALADEYEAEANINGYTLDRDELVAYMELYRSRLVMEIPNDS